MNLLYKYPCGCVGWGVPQEPQYMSSVSGGGDQLHWRDVLVVRECDVRWGDEGGWGLPRPRLLAGRPEGEKPVPLSEGEEDAYYMWLRRLEKDASSWRGLVQVVRDLNYGGEE